MMDIDGTRRPQPNRERIFNAPLAAVLLAVSIPALFLLQTILPDQGLAYAFRPVTLVEGGWWPGLLTSVFLHGSWGHALLNAVFVLACGAAVARLFSGLRGGLVFFAYYIVCHLAGVLGFGLLHLNGADAAVPTMGASAAVFGLMGGAMRTLGASRGLRPISDRVVVSPSLALMAVNLAAGVLNLAPGVVNMGDASVRIAWEAHAFGYLAGLILIGPLYRFFGAATAPGAPASMNGPWSG